MRYAVFIATVLALPLAAQTAGPAPAPDVPSIKVGAVVFGDYTYMASVAPPARDADGNEIRPSSFNISRAYINVYGSLNRYLSFRVTPEVARETGTSSLSGSQTLRLKFAWAEVNLERWLTKGSWIRAGLTQTPWIDYEESIYRYRFQGPVFVDREGFLFASDNGVTFHYNAPRDSGDVQAGVYNGEGWAHSDPNGEKALQLRGTLRPFPAIPALHGLRVTAFYDADHYAAGLPRNRSIGQLTYEHTRVNAGVDLLATTDRPAFTSPESRTHGSSVWATPRFGHGWEALLRRDTLHSRTGAKTRDIEGVARWFPMQAGISTALMFDRDATRGPLPGTHTTNYAVRMLFSF
jgi:hypothetical protein